jgi:hypothetical protein
MSNNSEAESTGERVTLFGGELTALINFASCYGTPMRRNSLLAVLIRRQLDDIQLLTPDMVRYRE